MTEDMKWKIKDSKFVVFNDEGHVPFFENCNEFNKEVEAFIESIL
jgi:pimeloyl-ACP methyl ester carboxylesterase